jgi:hypothetical protein
MKDLYGHSCSASIHIYNLLCSILLTNKHYLYCLSITQVILARSFLRTNRILSLIPTNLILSEPDKLSFQDHHSNYIIVPVYNVDRSSRSLFSLFSAPLNTSALHFGQGNLLHGVCNSLHLIALCSCVRSSLFVPGERTSAI